MKNQIKQEIDEEVYQVEINGLEDVKQLSFENYDEIWTKKVYIKVRVMLDETKI